MPVVLANLPPISVVAVSQDPTGPGLSPPLPVCKYLTILLIKPRLTAVIAFSLGKVGSGAQTRY